jgi:O-antigen ligase
MTTIGKDKPTARDATTRRLSLWVAALAALVFALTPLVINPNAIMLYVPAAFYLPKFKLLMYLSVALLVAVLGANLSGARFIRVPVLLPALAFLGISTLSTLFSGDIAHSLIGEPNRHDGLLTLAAGVLLFYAAARFLDSWAKVRIFLAAGVASATLISIYGILQQFGLDPVLQMGLPWYVMEPVEGAPAGWYPSLGGRSFATLGWPLWLAAYLTLMAGAALALYFKTKARWERAIWLAAMAIMAVAWLYTYSRGPMLAVLVTVPLIFFIAYRRFGTIRPLLVPLAVVAAAIITAHLAGPQSMDLFGRFGNANLAPTLEEVPEGGDVSVKTRLLMWRDTIPVILQRPLIGHGPDNFAEPFKRHEGDDLRAFFPNSETIDKAHNEFLQVAATTGLLGLAAYLWLFVSYFRHAYRSGGWPLLALSGGVLAYILQLQTAFTTITTGVTFWAILGVSVAVMRIQARGNSVEDSVGFQKSPEEERGASSRGGRHHL